MSTGPNSVRVYGHSSPNLSSIQVLLRELAIPHDAPTTPSNENEAFDYLGVNPKGGEPFIYDPSTQVTLGETGAIFEYLVSTYDKEHRLIFRRGTPEFWHAKQWLCFHIAVQSPTYGQAQWFKMSHEEKFPSVIQYYVKEVNRVTGVLEAQLAKQEQKYPGGDGPWVVGDKLCFVDIALVSWQTKIGTILGQDEYDVDQFLFVKSWIEKVASN